VRTSAQTVPTVLSRFLELDPGRTGLLESGLSSFSAELTSAIVGSPEFNREPADMSSRLKGSCKNYLILAIEINQHHCGGSRMFQCRIQGVSQSIAHIIVVSASLIQHIRRVSEP